MVFFPGDVARILSVDQNALPAAAPDARFPTDIINAVTVYELTTYLRDTLLRDTDCMSMAHSLEVRVPFLDHVLVEKILTIPGNEKLSGPGPKQLLVDAAGELLPPECYNRPKQGFVFPFAVWLKNGLREYCAEKLSRQNIQKISLLDPEVTERIWNDFSRGSGTYNYSSVIALLSFVSWHERYCQQ
jgi:asparagine synthase (glutamine-hydrolysing)